MYAMHKWMFIVAFTTLSGMEAPSHWDMRRAAGFLFPAYFFVPSWCFFLRGCLPFPGVFSWGGMFPAEGLLFPSVFCVSWKVAAMCFLCPPDRRRID